MINSFWNICSTCPMPKEEKMCSSGCARIFEYKRNYVWHPSYKPLPQDVVSTAPQPVSIGIKEATVQRRKQYPDLAYRTHEVIGQSSAQQAKEAADLRARVCDLSEERNASAAPKSGPRSRSAEPRMGSRLQKTIMVQSYPPLDSGRNALRPKMEELPKVIEQGYKATEYQSQFAWPCKSGREKCTARKSVSMGLIKAADQPTVHAVPKFHAMAADYQPVKEKAEKETSEKRLQDSKKKIKTEYKAKYKPFTSYVYIDGQWKKTSRLVKVSEKPPTDVDSSPWYTEVMERLKKANEYKCRGHGHPLYGEQLPNIYSQQRTSEVTPLVRPKSELSEIQIHLPRTPSEIKKSDKKKEKEKAEVPIEKKTEKEKSVVKRRPKSAEPVKAKDQIKPQRPATTPPVKERPTAPLPAHHAYAKRFVKKGEPVEKAEKRPKSASRSQVSRKTKSDSFKPAPSLDGRASRASHHPDLSSCGKVWLQAGVSVPSQPEIKSPKHSDAVRPSTLLPSVSPSKLAQEKLATETEVPVEETTVTDGTSVSSTSTVPLTHVRTPEEVTGVKSPEPENWTVPVDSGQELQWSEKILQSKIEALSPSKEKSQLEMVPEKSISLPLTETVPVGSEVMPDSKTTPGPSARMTTADVLDRARSRLDQFWGKHK